MLAVWQKHRQKTSTRFVRLFVLPTLAFFILWVWAWRFFYAVITPKPTPYTDKYIGASIGNNGRWYIPPSWLENMRDLQPYPNISDYLDLRNPREPAEAAHLALELAMRREKYMRNSKIPLIIHQTWKDCDSDKWAQPVKESVDAWLQVAVGDENEDSEYPEMAYILWDDEAILRFFALYEPDLWVPVNMLPHPVEITDVFRVAVLKWFGGIYADIDTLPLEHPVDWVHDDDLGAWVDSKTSHKFELHEPLTKSYIAPENSPRRPHPYPDSKSDITPASYKKFMTTHAPTDINVAAIYGVEADTRPDSDDYWRAGYTYPVQLTNWAFAMAPHHPSTSVFLKQVGNDIKAKAANLAHEDPLDLTGPPAFTKSVKQFTEGVEPGFRWYGITCLDDPVGGRGKIVAGDILVLPITGFSPGRGRINNMGSQPLDHPNARLFHAAQGSWRKVNIKVTVGKLCRTLVGGCKNWSKVP